MPRAFSDGRRWRLEIPSVEGPAALEAVLVAADELGVRVDRVSQGSGVALLRQVELEAMARTARAAGVELVLWAGLRGAWDLGAQARASSGAAAAGAVRGRAGLAAGLDEAVRAAEAGVAGVLVADLGLLVHLARARSDGRLPAGFVLKVSISFPVANPATAATLETLGASTLNLPVDLPLADIADIRAGTGLPLDCYVEGADDFGGVLRYHELASLVEAAAPVHLKFGLRNVQGTYPAGGQVDQAVLAGARERVRRAAIGLELLGRQLGERSEGAVPTRAGRSGA